MKNLKRNFFILIGCILCFLLPVTVKADKSATLNVGQSYKIQLKGQAKNLKYNKDKISVRRTRANKMIVKAKATGKVKLEFEVNKKKSKYIFYISPKQSFSKQRIRGVYADNVIRKKGNVFYQKIYWHPLAGADGYYIYKVKAGKATLIKRVYGTNRSSCLYKTKSKTEVYQVKAFKKVQNKIILSKANKIFKRQVKY